MKPQSNGVRSGNQVSDTRYTNGLLMTASLSIVTVMILKFTNLKLAVNVENVVSFSLL